MTAVLCHVQNFVVIIKFPWHMHLNCNGKFVNEIGPRSTSVQLIARCLFCTKPLPKPMLTYCQWCHQGMMWWLKKRPRCLGFFSWPKWQTYMLQWYILMDRYVFPYINTLWSSDSISWYKSGSASARVKPCCLMEPKHYLNQYWLIIYALCDSPESSFTKG